ncbi:hypothetical protein [Dyella nitratireducens]|uniref:Secreted protein n=1 Tax=Dyella nitratireducens TaxID=1849580 RepID=A0ABQ1GBQ6_9GAMM|nr:hypothetical protein [Dyella nitratireducens]GGA40686.1 hypothetical protein GCM10010981_32370 [Dyella nitratireducens]GLQ40595.1 hypothetical protein GCM10007902_04440 [Dyella nitratireducens]
MLKVYAISAILLIAALPRVSNAASIYVVHQDGVDHAFICSACTLAEPFPDATSAGIISNWETGTGDFLGPAGQTGITHTLQPGDTVQLCNVQGCETYTESSEHILTNGTNHPFKTNTCPAGG